MSLALRPLILWVDLPTFQKLESPWELWIPVSLAIWSKGRDLKTVRSCQKAVRDLQCEFFFVERMVAPWLYPHTLMWYKQGLYWCSLGTKTNPSMQVVRALYSNQEMRDEGVSLHATAWGTLFPLILKTKCVVGREFSTSQTGGWPRRFPQTPEPSRHSQSNPIKQENRVGLSRKTVWRVENRDLWGPTQAQTQIFMNMYDPEQRQAA